MEPTRPAVSAIIALRRAAHLNRWADRMGRDLMNRFGFDERHWEAAKTEAKEVLAACAKQRQMIPYSEFVTRVQSIQIDAHDLRLAHFLEEISTEESAAGRGMLTALVVHKR